MSRIKEPSTWAGIASIFAAMASLPIPAAQPWLAGVGVADMKPPLRWAGAVKDMR